MPLLAILIVQGVSFLTGWILVNNWGQRHHDSFDWQLLLQRNLPISNLEWLIEPGRGEEGQDLLSKTTTVSN